MVSLGAETTAAPPAVSDTDLQLLLQDNNYDGLKAMGAKLSDSDRASMLNQALDSLPSCYGARIDNCLHGHWDASPMLSSGDCLTAARGYIADFDKFDAEVEALPYCDETRIPLYAGFLAVGAGVAFGVLFGALLS